MDAREAFKLANENYNKSIQHLVTKNEQIILQHILPKIKEAVDNGQLNVEFVIASTMFESNDQLSLLVASMHHKLGYRVSYEGSRSSGMLTIKVSWSHFND